jgi:hypothetical protein
VKKATRAQLGAQKLLLTQRRETLLEYLFMKLQADDLHAVQDAASDIRELDAIIATLAALQEGKIHA